MDTLAAVQEARSHRSLNFENMATLSVVQELRHSCAVVLRSDSQSGRIDIRKARNDVSLVFIAIWCRINVADTFVNFWLDYFAECVLPYQASIFNLVVLPHQMALIFVL